MAIHVALHHETTYSYDRSVSIGPQVVRLRPAPHAKTRILAYSLRVEPETHFVNWQQDPESNFLARLVFPENAESLSITVDLVCEMAALNPFDFFLEPSATESPFRYDRELELTLAPYRRVDPSSKLLDAFVDSVPRDKTPTNDFLVALNQRVQKEIRYLVRLEPGLQTPEETLEKKSGSCRDSGWLLVMILRRLGFAARFVSGYLIQLAPDVKPLEGPEGPTQDFVDLHAWCEVYLPGAGWIGLDPTSGLLAGEGHIPLAATAEPQAAAPVSGMVGECKATLHHAMTVTRIVETPRVTKPYAEEEWAKIEALGHAIDEELRAADVRLTMGGEPTFVSTNDLDADEWNTAALGPTKKKLAADLYHRLRTKYAREGLVHFGQGKWYPGEQLPRWALNLFWRKDGEALWSNDALIAREDRPTGATEAIAGEFLRGVSQRLGVDPRFVFPAFEDVYYYLWRERRLPVNVDPFDARLEDPLERDRLRRVFSQGLAQTVGHALPIERAADGQTWLSGPWHLRGERAHLVPGDSPMGYRLPLDGQPWAKSGDREQTFPPDPMQAQRPLATRAELKAQLRPNSQASMNALTDAHERESATDSVASRRSDAANRVPGTFESASWIVRSAMCAEPRNGVLYVFMPPTRTLDDYVALVAAVEATAEAMSQPVLLEGYPPPRDARLESLSITPDPGVIEVNIHPSKSWSELVDRTTHLYEAARESRLATEKFMVDGAHAGTGGGNHVVLGGATAEDSPFLRRPDLLRSLLSAFHQHPSLSFLFSGMFIGPTSQSPRVDEARNDQLYELEIAFREVTRNMERYGGAPPWAVDRIFRDLLVDVSGNTHRTEMCIDKMFSPDGPSGRHGLLELRALEMPPHSRMSLATQLLLRALVARLWKTPLAPERLARWDTELHDRFMLPFFVWQDFEDVIAECRAGGHALETAWFEPHFEFRFPKIGDFSTRGMEIELRAALEPWHVTGEDGAPGGTARYVDSSLERLQVKTTGVAPDRYVVTCNGIALPLQPTGTNGEMVAGVRYRAWQPPRCLHPLIGVDSPLTFDLVDTWMKRSLGGCQVHVSHPGGRAHSTRPINALEAEGRRRARFFRMGHTPGTLDPEPPRPSEDFPFTLDLRRYAR